MALSDITVDAILQAIAEFDRLGREAFLQTYGFAPARRYWIRYGGKAYDSKAIVGVAHGYLPRHSRLRAAEFSGGVDHAVAVLRHLGFDVTEEPAGAEPDQQVATIVQQVAALRPAYVNGGPMLKQAVVLLWAIGRARAGHTRLLEWRDTVAALAPLLEEHLRDGERHEGRPDYPIAALYRADLWDLAGHTDDVPPAHGDSALRSWFNDQTPHGGLPEPAYDLIRRSGQARIRLIEAVTARFFGDLDDGPLLNAVGLYDEQAAADAEPSHADGSGRAEPPSDPRADYARWCELVGRRESQTPGRRRTTVAADPIRLGTARRAVLLRSEGRCENPDCARPAPDVTDRGDPILEVDHVEQIADGGRDHPTQMIALCPNCHAVKTRGRSRHQLTQSLLRAAQHRHDQWIITPPATG